MIDPKVLIEQSSFNLLLRPNGLQTEGETTEFLKDMGLNVLSEVDELLRTTQWKKHRRPPGRYPNRDHQLEELVDMFKLWLTIWQTLGYSVDEVEQAFWRKSMVVRQRHSEEWVRKLDHPAVVVDIDNVLCDYTRGFCDWIIHKAPLFAKKAKEIRDARSWFGKASDFGMTEGDWQKFKHEFRSRGHKRQLPPIDGAAKFLADLRRAGYYIILLTSRPIDRYPNIYTDTLYWLHDNGMVYDWVWWALDKKECLVENKAVQWIKFAVDDDPKYVEQFRVLGIPTYWMKTTKHPGDPGRLLHLQATDSVYPVERLQDIPIPPVTNADRDPHGDLR